MISEEWSRKNYDSGTEKNTIKNEINKLTEKIDTNLAHKNACNRIINRLEIIKEEYKNNVENKEKTHKLISNNKNKKLRNR